MSTLKDFCYELFEKIIGHPVALDYTLPAHFYDKNYVMEEARRRKYLVVRAGQRITYKRSFWVYLPEVSPDWLEIGIKDVAGNDTFKTEKLRYSEAYKIEEFLKSYGTIIYGGTAGDHEFYVNLGDEKNLQNLIRIVMEENYKNGRHL